MVKVIHKYTKYSFDVHVLIHFWFSYRLKIQPNWHYWI